MPTLSVERDALFEALGKQYTEKEFDELCFEFGIELDEVTSERQMARKEQKRDVENISDAVLYKIDIPANRHDLLCLEGLARALLIFQQKANPPVVRHVIPEGGLQRMVVEPQCAAIRPYVVSCILRNVTFTQASYNSFLDLQDKLHQNICRRRTLVAIGTHDLDTIQGPFKYTARPPQDISFVPLFQTEEFRADQLLDFYRENPEGKHIKPYTDIIYDSPVYPVILDANETVLSLPPIINSDHSKMSVNTRNILIESTATDQHKAICTLNILVSLFSQYCDEPFTVEPVEVIYADGVTHTCPDLSSTTVSASMEYLCTLIGVPLEPKQVTSLCSRMQLPATYDLATDKIVVEVPPLRSDIMHACDIAEDVAIAYGFNNVPRRIPKTTTVGKEQPLNQLTDLLRYEIAGAGFMEVLTMALCSHDESFKMLNRVDDGNTAVVLSNPKTQEFQIARPTLLTGLLKTLRENRAIPVKDGVRLFEISDVVLLDNSHPVGARNVRRLSALYTGPTAGFEIIHGLVDRVLQLVGAVPSVEYSTGCAAEQKAANDGDGEGDQTPAAVYSIAASAEPTYFPGRCARVLYSSGGATPVAIGTFGVLHPSVLQAFALDFPCSVVELDLEQFL